MITMKESSKNFDKKDLFRATNADYTFKDKGDALITLKGYCIYEKTEQKADSDGALNDVTETVVALKTTDGFISGTSKTMLESVQNLYQGFTEEVDSEAGIECLIKAKESNNKRTFYSLTFPE